MPAFRRIPRLAALQAAVALGLLLLAGCVGRQPEPPAVDPYRFDGLRVNDAYWTLDDPEEAPTDLAFVMLSRFDGLRRYLEIGYDNGKTYTSDWIRQRWEGTFQLGDRSFSYFHQRVSGDNDEDYRGLRKKLRELGVSTTDACLLLFAGSEGPGKGMYVISILDASELPPGAPDDAALAAHALKLLREDLRPAQ